MHNTLYAEGPACFAFQGQTFCADGALVTEDRCAAYLGERGELVDWRGRRIGRYRITARWPTPRSWLAAHMCQVEAHVEGRIYTGRSCGEGMLYRGRRIARQRSMPAAAWQSLLLATRAGCVRSSERRTRPCPWRTTMSYTNRSSSRRSVTLAEEQAWIGFYKRVGDAAVAAELIQYLEADPELKRAHAALYLRAKESVSRHKEREARAKRIGAFVRMVSGTVVIGPVNAVRRLFRAGGEVAIALLAGVCRRASGTSGARSWQSTAEYAGRARQVQARAGKHTAGASKASREASRGLPKAT